MNDDGLSTDFDFGSFDLERSAWSGGPGAAFDVISCSSFHVDGERTLPSPEYPAATSSFVIVFRAATAGTGVDNDVLDDTDADADAGDVPAVAREELGDDVRATRALSS